MIEYCRGQEVIHDGVIYAKIAEDADGFALFGPYANYAPGRYAVDFEIFLADDCVIDFNSICCVIDVCSSNGHVVHAEKSVYTDNLSSTPRIFTLVFDLRSESIVEFRLRSIKVASLLVRYERKAYQIEASQGQFCPMLRAQDNPDNEFVRDHLSTLRWLDSKGIEFDVSDTECFARASGVSIEIKNREDFQVIAEIFDAGDYRILMPSQCAAIDIGMNVGIASLYFASQSLVESVYSFEPFSAPYLRAMRNFALNKNISKKVKPQQFGLSDRDHQISVGVDSSRSISTSIRGVESVEQEQITLKDAGTILGPIIKAEKALGRNIVLKIDCEGSEFPIMESLVRADLINKIDGFMIEWHKWWSAKKNRTLLLAPLLENNFVIFDRTPASNPHAGMIYAARR